jgi:D-alanyl-D-alanine carboxypeptidase
MSSPRSSRAQARRVYYSAGRRRRNALRRIAAAAVVLFALALAWTRIGDDRAPRAGTAAGSREVDSGKLGSQDGYVPVGASLSPFSDEPAVARLDPVLRDALRQAATDAGADGITLRVNGGWRSAQYQRALLRRAVETYGSIEAARQFALPPAESKHVTGEAVDVGPTDADDWLSQHGNEYGLCQIYANEPWHFELATAPSGACPPMISNAAGG